MLVYDQQLYHDLYEARVNGRTLRYGREFLNLGDPPHWELQRQALEEFRPRGAILLVGCGFSPLLSALRGRILGTDPSPFIQANKERESDVPNLILPHKVPTPDLDYRWGTVITDDVCPSYPVGPSTPGQPQNPTELREFLDGCSSLGRQVIHFVTTRRGRRGDPRLTWLTLDKWASFAPTHTWIDNSTMEVINGLV